MLKNVGVTPALDNVEILHWNGHHLGRKGDIFRPKSRHVVPWTISV